MVEKGQDFDTFKDRPNALLGGVEKEHMEFIKGYKEFKNLENRLSSQDLLLRIGHFRAPPIDKFSVNLYQHKN